MEVIVKNVTEEYKKAFRIKNLTASIFNFILAALFVVICFMPMAKIGEYSVGNGFQIIIGYVKSFIEKQKTSFSYLTYFVLFSCVGIFCLVIFLIKAIEKLKEKADVYKFFINEKDLYVKMSFKFIFKQFLRFLLIAFLCTLAILPTKLTAQKYGFTFSLEWWYILAFLLCWIKGVACGYITLMYDERGSESKRELLAAAEKGGKKDIGEKKSKRSFKPNFFHLGINVMIIVIYVLFAVMITMFGALSYYNAMFGGYNVLGFNSVAGWVVSFDDENLLRFDTKTLYGGFNRVIYKDEFWDYYIGLEINNNGQYEGNTKSFTFYGDSYRYNCQKIEELKKEILELKPEENTEESLKQYFKQIEIMAKTVKVLESNVNEGFNPYEYVDFVDGYMVDLQYNATGKNTIKWGVKVDGFKGLVFKEKITLTDKYCQKKKPMDRFAVGTDFSKELIVARVQYSDGSVRISKVIPTNIEELNNAQAGNHILKWKDSWGEYQTYITIYNV